MIRSATGPQLERASILAVDSKGKRVPPMAGEFEGIRCHETRPHALSSHGADDSREEQMERDGRLARFEASLTDFERVVLRLQGKLRSREEVRERIPAGDLAEYLRNDYVLLPGSEETLERAGMPPISTVVVIGYELVEVEALDYEQIAERYGKTVAQVRRAVVSANKKGRAATR